MLCSVVHDQMLDVLYDEAAPATRQRVEEHLEACPDCRSEMAALRRLRSDLAEWKLPSGLGARRHILSFRPRLRLAGVAALAAGLVLALGAALGLTGSELRYEEGRVAFRLGRAAGDVERLLAEQEARHREEIRALRASLAAGQPRDDEGLLLQVQDMIHLSEARQAALLRTSLTDLAERTDSERRYDLARMSAGLSYLDGKAGEHAARTTELMGYVLQAAQSK